MTLIGFTEQRGHAWHYRASKQGAEPNHYSAAIPVEDVRRRLFGWTVLERYDRQAGFAGQPPDHGGKRGGKRAVRHASQSTRARA